MSFKRPQSFDLNDTKPSALLLNVVTGVTHPIFEENELTMGRALTSSIILEESYISRLHCIIKYDAQKFILKDNSCSGTYLNCVQIPTGKTVKLEHGDVIGIGEPQNFKFSFKFILHSNSCKKPKFDEDEIRKTILKLQSDIINIRKDFSFSVEKTQSEMNELYGIISHMERAIKLLRKDHYRLQSLSNLKHQIQAVLENELQCPICNEFMVKACSANCEHSFCESCLREWMSKSNKQGCPVCRTPIKTTANSLAIDNYITKICDLLGGTFKEQRDNLIKERSIVLSNINKKGRKKKNTPNNRSNNPDEPPTIVAIVDLTSSGFS